jgi:hypothetical protein
MSATCGNRSGFAMATALFILVVAAVAMAAVGALLTADVHRTLNGSADAQLRQLLIVAEIDAPSHLSITTQDAWTTALPASLAGAKVETRRIPSADGAELRVTATLDGRSILQELKFAHLDGGGWHLQEAVLSAPTVQH